MTKQQKLETALVDLLEWAKGNRGRKDINPYGVPEVKAGLETLTDIWGRVNYLEVDLAPRYKAIVEFYNAFLLFETGDSK